MEHNYKNIIPHIDIDRNLDSFEFYSFDVNSDNKFLEFKQDMESANDSIELQLIKHNSYKEALVLRLKNTGSNDLFREFLKEEQKTFGGSKIFYMNSECTILLVLGIPNEIKSKLNMVIARINKVNEKISRMNSKIKKDNIDLYSQRIKDKSSNKTKEEIINFINQNLRV